MIGNEEGPGGSPRQRVEHRLIRARRTPADPLESRRGTGTNHRPAAPRRNPYRRRRTTELSPPVTHIHAERPQKVWVAALQGGGPPPCRPVTCTYGAPSGT